MAGVLALTMSQSVYASKVALSCKSLSGESDQKNFASFDLEATSATLEVTMLVPSDSLRKDLTAEVSEFQKDLADASKTEKEKLGIEKTLKALNEFLDEDGEGLVLHGRKSAYTRAPKTPRIRYALEFDSKNINDQIFDFLAPEADRATLFVQLIDGKPTYDKITIEYDGSQGPYYDYFECK